MRNKELSSPNEVYTCMGNPHIIVILSTGTCVCIVHVQTKFVYLDSAELP